jgi:hypothetical protein
MLMDCSGYPELYLLPPLKNNCLMSAHLPTAADRAHELPDTSKLPIYLRRLVFIAIG